MKKILLSALALVALASCAKNEGESVEITDTWDGELRISSGITTRASGTLWDSGDAIGVFMNLTDGGTAVGTANTKYITTGETATYTSAIFTVDSENYADLYYPTSANVDLLAYYPYVKSTDEYTFYATAYPVDVKDQTTQGDIDLMVAKITNQAKTTSAVDLEFDHKLSNIVLNVVNGDGYDKLEDIGTISSIELSGSVTTADFNLTDDTISLGSDSESISFVVSQSSSSISAEAIIIPQTLSGSSAILTVTTSTGAVHSVALNGTFAIGTQYSYTLNLNLTELNISGATINDWNKVSGGELEASVPEPVWDGTYPTDVAAAKEIVESTYSNGVYQIDGVNKFAAIAYLINNDNSNFCSADIVLTSDLNLGGEVWAPIGSSDSNPFMGSFDGQGHTISGLSTTGYIDYKGLIGRAKNATINNVGVSGSISGKGFIAGIAGKVTGSTIYNCWSECAISGSSYYVGGIAGAAEEDSYIINCYNSGSVSTSSGSYTGGIVGYPNNTAIVYNCYNTGYVSGKSSYGAVVGTKGSNVTLTYCYYLENNGAADNNTTSMSLENMQNIDFAQTLNTNAAAYNNIESNVAKLCGWLQLSDNYPTLDFDAEPTAN